MMSTLLFYHDLHGFSSLIYPLKCQLILAPKLALALGVDNKHHWPFFHIKLSAEEETIPLCCGHPLFFSDSEWESNCFQAKQVWREALLLLLLKKTPLYSTLIMTKKSPYLKGQMDSHILFCFLFQWILKSWTLEPIVTLDPY